MIVDLKIDGKTYKDVEVTNVRYQSKIIDEVNKLLQKEANLLTTHDTCGGCKENSCERR